MSKSHLPSSGNSDPAANLGKAHTESMVGGASPSGIDELLDQHVFVLDPKGYDAFVRVLDHAPTPGPKLRSLLRPVPA